MSIEHLKSAEGARPEAQEIASSMPREERQLLEQQSVDTEAGMLSGISQKHNMRSSPCRFTEFCNSQCLSHFAAPFIVVRTETSIAESCELHMANASNRRLHQSDLRDAVAVGTNGYVIHPAQPNHPRAPAWRTRSIPTQTSQKNSQECYWNMCE